MTELGALFSEPTDREVLREVERMGKKAVIWNLIAEQQQEASSFFAELDQFVRGQRPLIAMLAAHLILEGVRRQTIKTLDNFAEVNVLVAECAAEAGDFLAVESRRSDGPG